MYGGNVDGIRISSSSNSPYLRLYQNSGTVANRNWGLASNYTTSGLLEFQVSSSNTTDPTATKMVIDSTGNVGIGTTGPGAKLEVGGTLSASSTPYGIKFNSAVTNSGAGSSSTIGALIGPTLNPAPSDYAELMRISGTIVEAGSGDHSRLAGLTIVAPSVTAGVATVTNAMTLYINAAPTATVSGGNFALYSEAGTNYFGGNVGIGTTEPLQKLHVEGQCVTSDTLLPIRRRRRKKNLKKNSLSFGEGKGGVLPEFDDDWEYLLTPITDIQTGDEVLSLNKNKGLVEYHKIKGLMDMGVKDVYELRTKSGRVIRTTANHPYLVKIKNDKLRISNENMDEKKLTNDANSVRKNITDSEDVVKFSENHAILTPQGRDIEKLFLPFSKDNQKNNSNGEQSSENINIDHRVIDNRHDNYDLINIKQIVQNTKESANPNKTTDQLKLSANNGPINTEAKNICPTSAEMSESFASRDSFNVNDKNFIHHDNTPREDILSRNPDSLPFGGRAGDGVVFTEPIRNTRNADLCPYCLRKDFVKRGVRKNKNQTVQLYLCRNTKCGKTFTAADVRGKHFPLHIIIESMSYYNLGFTLEETCRIIKKKFGIAPLSATLSEWINEYKPLCRYERLRSYAMKLFSPKNMIEVVTMAHRQLYRFRYHRAKTILMLEEFRNRALFPLKNYLDNVSSETPHQYFSEGERMSEIRSKFDKADMIVRAKTNFANRLTAFVLQSIPDNKQRHEELQRFMLANDSCTVATEVPVYIRKEDVEHLENELKFKISDDGTILLKGDKQPRKMPKLLTGHIDIVQIRNGQLHLLDYKPNASKERPIEQLTWYAMAMSRLTGLRMFNFTCAWFDERDYYQFYPLHVVKKLTGTKKRRVRYRSGEIAEIPRKDELVIVRNRGPDSDKGG